MDTSLIQSSLSWSTHSLYLTVLDSRVYFQHKNCTHGLSPAQPNGDQTWRPPSPRNTINPARALPPWQSRSQLAIQVCVQLQLRVAPPFLWEEQGYNLSVKLHCLDHSDRLILGVFLSVSLDFSRAELLTNNKCIYKAGDGSANFS